MPSPAVLLLAIAAGVLALDPLLWLAHTWREPSYDSHGFLVAGLTAALAVWSATSQRTLARRRSPRVAVALLGLSAVARAIGQVGAVNVLGALTLVLDVYAIAALLRLDARRRPIAPGWLALSFAFALPIERIVQRSLGYGLQHVSAEGACGVLGALFDAVTCSGVRITLDGRDVLVDLPCSGARTLMLTGLAFAVAAALVRPNVRQALIGGVGVLTAALLANVMRIVALAIGIAHPRLVGGIDVMAEPWHDAIGLASLALALLPLGLWARAVERSHPAPAPCAHLAFIPHRLRHDGWWLETRSTRRHSSPWLAIAALVAAATIVNLPRRPIDTARAIARLDTPAWIGTDRAEPVALLAREEAYFTQYGGAAAKARYGWHSLLLVRTSSPLRHLHAPDECLRGLGFTVTYLGQAFSPVPTARYVATSPAGERYRIDVSFVSDRGEVTGSVAGAVWRWLSGEAAQWTAIQRISPADMPEGAHAAWSAAVLTVLGVEPEIPPTSAVSSLAKGVAP